MGDGCVSLPSRIRQSTDARPYLPRAAVARPLRARARGARRAGEGAQVLLHAALQAAAHLGRVRVRAGVRVSVSVRVRVRAKG